MWATYKEIAYSIHVHKKEIIKALTEDIKENPNKGPISTYCHLKEQLLKIDVSTNENFQKNFTSFYGMYHCQQDYLNIFFRCMEEQKNIRHPNFMEISVELYSKSKSVKSKEGKRQKPIHQFSFITKMINLMDDNFPIYDINVGRVFRYNREKEKNDFEKRIKEQTDFIDHIKNTYYSINNENLIESAIRNFEQVFSGYKMPFTKKIDFMIWKLGGSEK